MKVLQTKFTTTWTCPGCDKVTPIDVYDCVKDFEFMPSQEILEDPASISVKCTHAIHLMDFIHEEHDTAGRLVILAVDTPCFEIIVRILSNPASFVERDTTDGEGPPH